MSYRLSRDKRDYVEITSVPNSLALTSVYGVEVWVSGGLALFD